MNTNHNVHCTIYKNAKLHPQKVAIQFADETITYQELELRIKCLSHKLQAEGIKKGDIVALYIQNSIELIVSIYAILYCRAIVLPVDIDTPIKRIHEIFSDSQAELILVTEKTKKMLLWMLKVYWLIQHLLIKAIVLLIQLKLKRQQMTMLFAFILLGLQACPKEFF